MVKMIEISAVRCEVGNLRLAEDQKQGDSITVDHFRPLNAERTGDVF